MEDLEATASQPYFRHWEDHVPDPPGSNVKAREGEEGVGNCQHGFIKESSF